MDSNLMGWVQEITDPQEDMKIPDHPQLTIEVQSTLSLLGFLDQDQINMVIFKLIKP
jgi:hypothetical protein